MFSFTFCEILTLSGIETILFDFLVVVGDVFFFFGCLLDGMMQLEEPGRDDVVVMVDELTVDVDDGLSRTDVEIGGGR